MALDPRTRELQNKFAGEFNTPQFKGEEPEVTPEIRFSNLKQKFGAIDNSGYKYEDFDPYIEGKIDPIRSDIEEQRAQGQSGIELMGKALGQSVNEMVLGTLESAGYLADVHGIGASIAGNEDEFDNWFSKIFRESKEYLNEEYLPIYQTNTAKNGALLDRTALASGAKNIATSLSLMIPAIGVARGINIAGKLVGIGAKSLALTEAIGAGLTSRAAEATMEAQQYLKQYTDQNKTDLMKKYESSAMEEINKLPLVMPPNEYGFSPYTAEQRQVEEQRILDKYKAQIDVESKQMAVEGANKVFKANGALAVIDAMQYMPIFKTFGSISDGVNGGKMLEVGLQMGSEAGEELYQSGAQAEAYSSIKKGVDMFGPGFSERFGEYLDSNEMKQSVFWGALGGGVFAAAAPLGKKIIDSATDISMWKDKLSRDGNVEAFTKLSNDERVDLISKHIKRNRLDKLSDELSVMEQSINAEDWQSIGTTKEQAASTIALIKEDIAFAKEEKAKLDANEKFNGREDAKLDFVKTKLTAKNNAKLIKSSTDEINNLYRDIEKDGELIIDLVAIKRLQDKISALKSLKTSLNKIPSFKKDSDLKNTVAKNTDLNIAVLSEKMAQLKELYIASNPNTDFDVILKTSKDDQITNKTYAVTELNTVQNSVAKPTLAAYEKMSHIEAQDSKIKEQRQKAQKEETKDSIVKAKTPEDINDIAESIPEENVDQVVNTTEDLADQEELDASDKPDLRYIDKPNLFIRDMNLIEGHVLSRYDGNIDEDSNSELLMITMSANADEFIKNYQSLYEVAKNDPNKMKLFATIQEFFEDIAKNNADKIKDSSVDIVDDVVEDYNEDEDEFELSTFPSKPTNSSDIGFIHSDEKVAQTPKQNRAVIREYTMTNGNIKKVNGVAEKDFVAQQMPIDWDYVNDPSSLLLGSEIYFVVNLNDTISKSKTNYHKGLKDEQFVNESQILIAQKDKDGVEHIVNALPIYNSNDNSEDGLELRELRDSIWKSVKSSGQRTGMFNSNIKTKVTKKYAGRLLTSKAKNKPTDVIKPGEPLVLGIAKNINGVTIINAGKNVSPEYSGIVVDNKNSGGVFILVKGANGRIIPARCFTQELTKFPKLYEAAKNILLNSNKDNWASNREELRKIVFFDYNYIAKTDSFEVRDTRGNVNTYTKQGIDDLLKGKIVQVSSSEINRGNYNESISNEGRLKTDLNPIKNIANANFEFSLDYIDSTTEKTPITVLPKEADDIVGDIMSNEPVVYTAPVVETTIASEEPSEDIDLNSLEDFENPLGDMFRLVNKSKMSNEEFYQKWNELKETQWFTDRFPESLINTKQFQDGLINVSKNGGIQAWGMFKNAIAYISGAAQTGTVYHEAFHVVFHLYLSPDQQAQLLKEASSKYKIDISDSIAIEERIADEFMEYVQTEESTHKTLGNKIKDFFKHLYQLIKSKLTNDITVNEVFYRAQHGMYKTSPFTRNVDNFKVTRYRDKDFKTPYEETRRAVALADFMRKALDSYIENNPEYKNLSRREVLSRMTASGKTGAKYKGVDMLALSARSAILKAFKDNPDATDAQKKGVAVMLNKFIKMDSDGKVAFESLGRKSLLQFSRSEGLRIKIGSKEISSSIDSAEGEPLMEFFEEESQNEGWQIKTENLSGKESLSNEVRKELSWIPKVDSKGAEMVDDLGFTIYQDFSTVYADIQRELANILDSEEMIERLSEMTISREFLKPLLEKTQSDNLFKTKMFVNFNRSHVDYKLVIQTKNRDTKITEYAVMSANRMGVKNILIDEWKDNSTNPLFNKTINNEGEYIQDNLDKIKSVWSAVSKRLAAKNSYDEKDMSDISRILNYIGITVSLDDMNMLNKDITSTSGYVKSGKSKVNEFKSHVDNIINKLTSGVNPFGATSLESESINSMSKTISKFRFELMESSFKNAENNTVYAHQVPTFLSRAISQFSGKNAISKIQYYQDTPFYRNSPWLNELKELESRNNFEYIEIDAIKYDRTEKGVRYTSMSEKDFENTAVNMYFNNGAKDYVYYKFPVVSDAPKMPFIKFRRYSTKDVVDRLFEVYKQETARIEQVKARQLAREELVAKGLSIPDELKEIKNYDSDKSRRFLFLSFLNSGNARKAVGSGNQVAIKNAINDWLVNEAKNDYDRLIKLEVFGKDAKGISNYDDRIDKKWGNTEAFHKDYFFNSFLANTQMMALFSGDPAFYKPDKSAQSIYSRTVDYQKRNKQNVSPKTTMDVNAVYELTQEEAAIEGKSVLEVNPLYNSVYVKDLEIESSYAELIFDTLVVNGLTDDQAGVIAAAYGYNYKELEAKKINVTDAQAYITLPRYREIMVGLGRWNKDLQTIYPKLLNGTASGSELKLVMQPIKPFYFGHTKVGNLIMPTQNKNSEYLLLPQLVKQSKELSKLYNYMIDNNISSANFNSAVKAGEFGAQKLEDIEKASIHELNNEDYGLQQETPEHHIDSRSLFGSQIRKLILSDISADAVFKINGNEFTRDQLVSLYQDIITEDLREDYNNVADRFDNISSIHDLLIGEILDRDLGEEREKAIEVVKRVDKETGEITDQFNLPLYHPYHAKSNESLLNSVFKTNVTKQKIKGGAFVQVSSFGFSNDLNLILDGKGLVGAEVMLPWWSKKYFEPLLDENGQLDINKVPANLREMIGYRIPTEDKYSMLPLVVKGFLPASAGGAVMLPMEITTISGSDFDIDKMYIMMPEFETSEDGQDIRKVEFEYKIDISSQPKSARNNAKIDIIRAILTHEDTFSKIIKPGGFPTLESLAKKVLGLEGKADEMLSIALPSTQTELFKRNMTGKQLIGIFANHNTSHAIMQFTNVELANSVNFDGKSLMSLHEVINSDGDFISRNVAEWLAAVVDNAKNPLSSFINVNTYTADTAAMMTRLGYPLETVVAFLSQPVLKEFSRLYFNYGSDRQAEAKALNELELKYAQSNLTVPKDFSMKTDELFANIEKKELLTSEQKMILDAFQMIKEQATALADLVRATRADTKGAGPTLSENEKLIQLRKDVLDNPELVDQDELLNGTVYPMENAFMEYGVSKPTELLSKYFPWFTPAFGKVKERMVKSIKSNTLTVKQIEQINYELLGFTATGFEFFNGSDKAEIINNMSKKVRAFKIKYPKKYEENFFVNKLVFKKDESKSYLPERFQFKNTGSLTELDKQQIKEHWLGLMEDSDLAIDKEFSSFAKDLVKYAFYTAGFQLNPNSFSHLVPVDFYSNLIDNDGQTFNDYLIKTIKEAENEDAFNEFIDQFFRNNSDDLSFVPAVDSEGFGNITGQINYINGTPAWFKVNKKDKKLRKDFIVGTIDNGKRALFSPFVSFREKGTTYLYQNMSRSGTEATYVLTSKLGIPNAALEYEKNELDLESVIPSNNPFKGKLNRSMIAEQANIKEDVEEIEDVKEVEVIETKVKPSDFISEESTLEYTPENITSLKPNEVFVFGSNTEGRHGKGAALVAKQKFGAVYGKTTGLQGQSYAIVTKDLSKGEKSISLNQIGKQLQDLMLFAKDNPDKKFYVTKLGSSLAGYTVSDITSLFDKLKNITPSNVVLPIEYESRVESRPSDEYAEITESLRSKIINEINNNDTLSGHLETTVADINKMDVKELGELYRKFCNR